MSDRLILPTTRGRLDPSVWLTVALMGGMFCASGAQAAACTPDSGFAYCQAFDYTGDVQSFAVPASVTSLNVRMWGAAGGGPHWTYGTSIGGGGGFTTGTVAVNPGESLSITVGQGGVYGSTGIFGGGGDAGSPIDGGAPGGGLSALATGSPLSAGNVLLVAGGGGGSGVTSGWASIGGGGGGTDGGAGGAVYGGGTAAAGGTQAGGGSAGTGPLDGSTATAGNQFQGGLGGKYSGEAFAGGGGGGGYYGGGGGADWAGGGGGSGYCAGSGVSACTTTAGSGSTPAGTSDPQYQTGIGAGVNGAAGGNGLVVLQWNLSPSGVPTLSEWGLVLLTSLLTMAGLYGVRRPMSRAG